MIVGRNWGLGLLFVLLLSVLMVELRATPDEDPSVRRVESVTPGGATYIAYTYLLGKPGSDPERRRFNIYRKELLEYVSSEPDYLRYEYGVEHFDELITIADYRASGVRLFKMLQKHIGRELQELGLPDEYARRDIIDLSLYADLNGRIFGVKLRCTWPGNIHDLAVKMEALEAEILSSGMHLELRRSSRVDYYERSSWVVFHCAFQTWSLLRDLPKFEARPPQLGSYGDADWLKDSTSDPKPQPKEGPGS